jgi:Zn-finger nucleic acid-binding protein
MKYVNHRRKDFLYDACSHLNVWLDRGKVQFTVKEKGQIMVPSIDEANQDKYVRMPQDDSLTRYLETRSADRRWA